MNDKIPALRLDHKPIRGHVTFELFDAKTKELVQKVEKENMVTNAIKNMLQAYAATNQMENIMPLATVGLGGLLMFDDELTEDVNNVIFPMSAHLVGYGMQDVNTENTLRGSKNVAESLVKLGENGRSVTVWDFGTSQANGTIKSVALTRNANPFRPLSNGVVAQANYYRGQDRYIYNGNSVLAYEDGYIYVVHSITSSSERTGTYGDYTYTRTYSMTICKTYCPMQNYKVGDRPTNDLATENSVHQVLTWTQVGHNTDPDLGDSAQVRVDFEQDGTAYVIWSPGNSSGSGEIWVTKITRDGLEWSAEDTKIIAMTGCQCREGYHTIVDGHFMVVSYDLHSIYRVDIKNPVDIRQIVLPEGYYVHGENFWRTAALGGGLFFTAYTNRTVGTQTVTYYCNAILYPDYTVVLDGAFSSDIRIARHVSLPFANGYLFGGDDYGYSRQYVYGRYASNYLGTIANLATPIVKNASQTLKVTYTLTDA